MARRVLLNMVDDIYPVSSVDAGGSIVDAISSASGVDSYLIALELRRRLPERVALNPRMSRDFRAAMSHLCLAE